MLSQIRIWSSESVFGITNRNFGFEKNRISVSISKIIKKSTYNLFQLTKSSSLSDNQWGFSSNTSLDIWLWRNRNFKYDLRFTINDSKDSKNIINYCNFNKLSNVRHNILYKKRYNWTNQEVMELNEMITSKNMMIGINVNATLDSSSYVRFNLNQEIELSNLNESNVDADHPRLPLFIKQNLKLLIQDLDKQNIDQYLKTFRYKKRFSFTTPDKLFRFDLSIVKMSKTNEKNQGIPTYKFKDSYTLEQPENYEVEIEYRAKRWLTKYFNSKRRINET